MGAYAVSDLHGCYKQWKQIQSFCGPNDRIFVLGDCIDRSFDGFKTLKSVLNDSRTVLLCGNHEDMMANALHEDMHDDWDMEGYRWFSNGGRSTYDSWQEDGRNFQWISVIKNLPLWAKYTNTDGKEIIMTHSGVVPKRGYDISSCSRKALLWDRTSLRDTRWHRSENEIFIHGHTPIAIMPQFEGKDIEIEPGAFWYCNGHKCNLDNGGVWTGNICLLDLDTFDEHIFMGE